MANTCGVFHPQHAGLPWFEDDTGCLLKGGHTGIHLTKAKDGRFAAWEDDFECDCCSPEEHDRCTNIAFISETEAIAKIQQQE